MTRKLAGLFARAKYDIKNEGLIFYVKAGLSFRRDQLFFYRTYYLSEGTLKELGEAASPKIQDFTFRIISTSLELDGLVAEGFDFHHWHPIYRERLGKGAVAFCVFVGTELAHISWAALSEEGRNSLGEPPIRVDFENNEVLAGGFWTKPSYRGMGLAPYASYKRTEYLKEMGKVVSRGSIRKDNIAPQRVRDKRTNNITSQRVPRSGRSGIYAVGRHLKFLWWQSWKETPID